LKLPAGHHAPMISLGASHGLVLAPDGSMWSWVARTQVGLCWAWAK
jgi:hypothetical protein